MFFVSLASLVAIIIEMLVIGQKCVDSAKRMDSEKKPSFYDIKFQKKWIENCDEAQKIMIGKCAFKAYSATNKLCAVLAGAFAMGALVFDIGFLPSFAVCLIWIINQSVYCKEAIRYHKAGNRVL